MGKNITLIGMAGAGKSAVGRRLAARLGCKFIDVDDVIQKKTGRKLQQILDDSGDQGFLDIEEETVLELGKIDKCVISPGGSVAYSAAAMEFLKAISTVVFLNVPYASIEGRLSDKEVRGIVGFKERSLKTLYAERLDLYRKYKDFEIAITEDSDIDSIVDHIMEVLQPV